jgi:hypothetical protein
MPQIVQNFFFKMIKLFVLSFFLFQSSSAQNISSRIDRKEILIGEQINYDLIITLPSREYKIEMGIPDSVAHFDILSKTAGDTTDKNGNFALHAHIVFTSFDSGSWAFPALQYKINRLNTSSQLLYTDSFRVNVGYMPLDKTGQPRDIRTVIDVQVIDWFWVYIGAGILFLLLTLFFVYRYLRNKSKNKGSLKRSATAYEEANKSLEELRRKNADHSLKVKDFHTMLADIFKTYYGKITGRDFMNNTTGDILIKLKEYELNAATAATTAEALRTGDAVKFAKYNPTYIENEAALDYVKNTIEQMELSLNKNKPTGS